MSLPREFMQVVVDRITSSFETEIEIVDLNGIIIAGSRRDRINQINPIVFEMLEDRVAYLEYKCELTGVSGAGAAIEFNDQMAGVFFIFGDGHFNKDIVSIVATVIKISIQYEVIRGQSITESRNEEYFVRDLLSHKIDTDNGEIIAWGTRFGYDMHLPRVAIVIDLQPKENEYFNINLNLGYDNSVEHMREIVKNKVRDNEFLTSQDIVSYYRDDCLLVIKSFLDINDREMKYKALDKICRSIYNDIVVNKLFQISIAYGRLVDKAGDIKLSYKDAWEIIELSKRFKNRTGVLSVQEIIFEDIAYNLNESIVDKCLNPIVSSICKANKNLNIDICNTVECYLENNMSLSKTAEKLFLHRNSVILRLEKIKNITGLDIANDISHLFLLKLAIIYIKINKGQA